MGEWGKWPLSSAMGATGDENRHTYLLCLLTETACSYALIGLEGGGLDGGALSEEAERSEAEER